MKQVVSFELNGNKMEEEVESHWTLLSLLREHLELTGTKCGCEVGECGACTVLVDGRAVNSCIFPVMEVEGKSVVTIEGISKPTGELHPLQVTFMNEGGVQCGFCTPGMIMAAKGLLDENPNPTEEEIRHSLAGNFCRCTGYVQIIKAVQAASQVIGQGNFMPGKSV
jgi:carbon-monoxide dehydrogenase small subunit